MRGNPVQPLRARRACRSIPACAGEPRRLGLQGAVQGVYPRVCGGTTAETVRVYVHKGLSPRVRGNRLTDRPDGYIIGSIPACAGEPGKAGISCRPPPVYPRVCGGTSPDVRNLAHYWGLSPRVRGNRCQSPAVAAPPRSIPACAGEPSLRPGRVGQQRVYPRVCGGTNAWATCTVTTLGLSPRVRGNPVLYLDTDPPPRSIPACAGEPSGHKQPAAGQWVYPRVCGGT